MLDPQFFFEKLTRCGVTFFSGVPDSLLKDFCAYVTDHAPPTRHIVAANEGAAVALAAGHHLATDGLPLVYMQNSGQGNATNPLLSLADPDVYALPMLLLIGWRGEPGRPDEPQHVKQGKVTLRLLEAMDIAFEVLPDEASGAESIVHTAVTTARERSVPFALIVRNGTFSKYSLKNNVANPYTMVREDAVKAFVDSIDEHTVTVSTTGKTSRELFEYRVALGHPLGTDFLTVGSMGHASQIALGIALERPDRSVYCLDGDGALIMHLGGLTSIGSRKPENFRHIVINNGAHDSVGGQPTAGFQIDIPALAEACGYRFAASAETHEEFQTLLQELQSTPGPGLLEVRVQCGARGDLGRPTSTPIQNKQAFKCHLQ